MQTNQQFSVSIHLLALLAAFPDQALTSEQLAASVQTHPVVIRRILGQLRQQGLVESRPGANGGWKLSRAAEEIHLCGVYDALSHDALLKMHPHPNAECPIGAGIRPALEKVFGQAEQALHTALSGFTVADILVEITNQQERKS